jgi:hypothetical protein
MTSPAAWHPDPFHRHELRYWDGARWTEHVSDRGQTSADPPVAQPSAEAAQASAQPAAEAAQAAAQPTAQATPAEATQAAAAAGTAPRKVYVDAHLQIGMRRRRLFADENAIWWGDDSHPYEGVTAMTYWAVRTVAAGASNIDYRLRLWRGKKDSTITFTGRGDDTRAAYDAVTGALFEHVGRRIVSDAIARVEAGETVDFAGWKLSREGAAQGKKQFAWGTPLQYVPTKDSARPMTQVKITEDGKERNIGLIDLPGDNGSLARVVFDVCERRFGS